jgi:DNA-binding GntR family transcriptional regulator
MAKTELARKILSILRDEQAEKGFHLREQWLADALGVSRSPVRTALKQLEQLQVIRSEPHQGQESYRYRLLIEPAALLEDSFHLTVRRVAKLRALHRSALDGGLENSSIAELFDIDAEFHETLGDACGNRFLAQSIRQQTRLRRLSEYEKYTSRERHAQSFSEHLAILDAIEAGDTSGAAERMREHILAANAKRPDFRKIRTLAHRRLTRR